MSTDIAVVTEQPNGLAAWAEGARSVHQLAEHIAGSAMVPQAYRGKPIDVLACWLTGQELGIAPMASLRAIDVIQGQPSLRAHAMRALVQSHGHEVVLGQNDDTQCLMRGRRKGTEDWQVVIWDIDRARKLGLTDKDQWRKQPRTMLIARATGEICRLIAADVLYAVPYATEELDEAPVRATATVTARDLLAPTGTVSPPRRTALEEALLAPAREYPIVDIGDAPVVDPPSTDLRLITPAQSKKLHALLTQTGRGDRDEGLRYLTLFTGRHVDTSKELLLEEARKAIDDLERQVADDGPTYEDVPLPEPTDSP